MQAMLGGGAAAATGTLSSALLGAPRFAHAAGGCEGVLGTNVIYNVCEVSAASLLLAANDKTNNRIKIDYLGSKAGKSPVAEFDSIPAVTIPAGQTLLFKVDLSNPAFAGGFGAIRARSVDITGGPSALPFQAYSIVHSPSTVHVVSGLPAVGTNFRLPLLPTPRGQTQRVRVVATVLGPGNTVVEIRYPVGNFIKEIPVNVGSTLSWDSLNYGISLSGGQLLIGSSVPLVVSAFVDRTTDDYYTYLTAL